MSIIMVVCSDIENGIGRNDGSLLFKLPKDMNHFKETTKGRVVLFGRKTWESLPRRPLPERKNYILTSNKEYLADGAKIVNTVEEVLKLSESIDVYICGGGEIYTQFMKYADKLIITHVHVQDASAEVFFPEYPVSEWNIISIEKHKSDKRNKYDFTFAEYNRIKKD